MRVGLGGRGSDRPGPLSVSGGVCARRPRRTQGREAFRHRSLVVPTRVVQRGALDVDGLEPEQLALRRIQEVREVGAHLGDRRVRGNDVMQGTRAQQVVVQRVDEPELVVGALVCDRHHSGQERRRQAGAADPVLIPERPVREHLGLADLEARVRVARHGDVGHGPHRRAAVELRDARRHLAYLVERLRVQLAGAAAAARVVHGRSPAAVGQIRVRGLPAVLVQPLAVAPDQDARAADAGDVGDVGRELDGLRREVGAAGGVVTVVPGGPDRRRDVPPGARWPARCIRC